GALGAMYLERDRIGRAIDRAKLLHAQRQWMNFSPPADQVAYDDDPRHFAALLAQPDYVQPPQRSANSIAQPVVVWQPAAARQLWRTGKPWPPRMMDGMIFLHERHDSAENRFLLAVNVELEVSGMDPTLAFELEEFRPATWTSDLADVPNGMRLFVRPLSLSF